MRNAILAAVYCKRFAIALTRLPGSRSNVEGGGTRRIAGLPQSICVAVTFLASCIAVPRFGCLFAVRGLCGRRRQDAGRHHFHGHCRHGAPRCGRRGDGRLHHQARRRDSQLPADAWRSDRGTEGRPHPVERAQPRTLVRKVLRQSEGCSERGGLGRRRADEHLRGTLHRQAQPACMDVAGSSCHLCREHPQGICRT